MTELPEPRTAAATAASEPTYPWHAAPPVPVRPEQTRPDIQGRRAGFVTRMLANVVDAGVVIGVLAAGWTTVTVVKFLWSPKGFHLPAPSFALMLVLGGAIEFVYLAVAWRTWGRTWGDELFGLRVLSFRGTRMRWPGAAARAALCVFVPIGIFWVIVSAQNRSVQDVLLRTSVVYDWPRRV